MKTELLFSSFPFIGNETVTLSQMQPSDAEGLAAILEENGLGFSPAVYMQTAEAAFLAKGRVELGFYRSESPNCLLGTVKVGNFDKEINCASVDYLCRSGQEDVAAAALSLVLLYLFERVGLNRLYAVRTAPPKSWRKTMERCGLTLEGEIRQCRLDRDGRPCNELIYGILKEELPLIAEGILLARRGSLSIVKMTGGDYELMAKWLSDERVLKYYEGRDNPHTLEMVIEKYQPGVTGKESLTPCIIRYEGRPVGYIQFYPICEALAELMVTEYKNPYGVDLFIGERDCRNKGLGPKVLRLLSGYLMETLGADVVVGDPQVWNLRSVNAFAAAGFVQMCILPEHELHEGKMEANVIMHRTVE